MARPARLVLPNIPHHITQRGIHGAAVFYDEEDRQLYRRLLRQSCERYGHPRLGKLGRRIK